MKGKKRLRDGQAKTIEASEQIEMVPGKKKRKSANAAPGTWHLFEPRAEWHSAILPTISLGLDAAASLDRSHSVSFQTGIQSLHKLGMELLQEENSQYESSEHEYYKTFMSSGTLSDKISALTLLIRESPLHNMQALESLLDLAKKSSRSQAIQALEALKDLFGKGAMLPSDRRLKPFFKQPGLGATFEREAGEWADGVSVPSSIEKVHLMVWAYEDWLKSKYLEIIKLLASWCDDEIIFARLNAVNFVFDLLNERPEQEVNLLHMLVNKLGDPDQKVASRASQKIIELQNQNPFIKMEIITAVESDVIFRPGQSMHAKYYAIITLNQTILSSKMPEVVRKVLDIYFSFFLSLLSRPQAVRLNYKAPDQLSYNKKGERQGGGGVAGRKAQMKQFKAKSRGTAAEDQVRERMLSAILTGINRAIPFTDTSDDFFDKNMDMLFKVTHSSNFNTSIQALMLIQELCVANQWPSTSDRFYRTLYESLVDPRLLTTSKHRLYVNLLHRAMRTDLDIRRVKAFVKRVMQIVPMHQPPFACAVLYMLKDLEGIFPSLQSFIDQPEAGDEEEAFRDVHDHAINDGQDSTGNSEVAQGYDGRKRDPQFSQAEKSCLWELDLVVPHFHPSVSLFASKLLTHESMPAKPSLEMHTLISFLDRFVYRNPKKSDEIARGPSIMQPLSMGDVSRRHLILVDKTFPLPVNKEAFWKMEGDKIGADKVFFHKYFNTKEKGAESVKKKKIDKKRKADSEDEHESDDEEEVWKALVDSRPELEGNEEGDEDISLDELDPGTDESDTGAALDQGDATSIDESNHNGDGKGLDLEDEDAILDTDDEIFGNFDGKSIKETGKSSRRKGRKRMLKSLPTFASVDEYATLIRDEEGESS